MSVPSIQLPNTSATPGLATDSSFTTAGTLLTIPSGALVWAKFVCRHEGSGGFWYGRYSGGTPTTTVYDFKLGPHDAHQMDNPPKGDIKVLASASGIGSLSYAADWRV